MDDYYLNLLDWGPANVLAIALGPSVYLWEAHSGSIQELLQLEEGEEGEEGGGSNGSVQYVSSVSWAPDGKHLAVGLSNSEVQLWDTQRLKKVSGNAGEGVRGVDKAEKGNVFLVV